MGYAGGSVAGVVTEAGLASAEKPDKEYPIRKEYGRLLRRTVNLPWGEQPKPDPGPLGWGDELVDDILEKILTFRCPKTKAKAKRTEL